VEFVFRPMSQDDAVAIAAWRYEPPYSFYDWTADAGDLALLLSEEVRAGRFFSVFNGGELVGFFEVQMEGADAVLGLGLRPDLTGRGLGLGFVEAGVAFAVERIRPDRLRLSVAAVNERAITVYERAGFERLRAYDHETNGGVHPFLELVRPG
jgi:[ribosomal protein S18]-alanine N-acetyltransferase